jgi:hypothetical protein
MSAGFTKARQNHMARPKQANAMALYWSSLEQTEYFIAWAEVMRDMRQVFRSPDIRRTLEAKYGTRAATEFSTWLDILETDGKARALESLTLTQAFNNVMTAQSAIGLAMNLGTVFKQWSAAIGHFMLMPTTDAIKHFYAALTNPGLLRDVWNNEAVQQRILQGISPEDRRLLDAAHASPSLAMEWLDLGRLPISLADAAFTTLVGAASYNYHNKLAIKAGVDPALAHAQALDYLDHVIVRTAQPATTQDKSIAENTAKGFGKALFLFKSDPRQKLAMSANAIQLSRRGDIKKSEAARRVFFSWMVYGLMSQAASDMWRTISRDDDKEELWDWRDYVASMIAGAMAGLPIFGAAIESAIRNLIGTGGYTNNANPIDAVIGRFVTAKGIRLALPKAMTAEDISVPEILAAATRDAAGIAQLLGVVSPKLAIVPAVLRGGRDIAGMGKNLYDAFTPEHPDDIAATIIREEKDAAKIPAEQKKQDIAEIEARLAALPENQRKKELRKLDKETRAAITGRLRRAEMSPNEKALAGLPLAARRKAVDRILERMEEEDRKEFLDRLDDLHINLPD